ncbi:MAG: alanine racemase [Pseudomonadota bacterium]
MGTGSLHIDLAAIAGNWRALDSQSGAGVVTAAVVKADAYGLGLRAVAETLAHAGARQFFVAVTEEGAALRDILGPGPEIFVFSGHMAGDSDTIAAAGLIPLLNSTDQIGRHFAAAPGQPFGIQLDTGMNRLGLEPADWADVAQQVQDAGPALVMSHLACADEADHPQNAAQLDAFRAMTDGISAPRSLAATGGILLGADYHFDMTRPGVGLYGGLPFTQAAPVLRLSLPVIQIRQIAAGETVGYGATWSAASPRRIATVSGGYADGLIRRMGNRASLFAGSVPCPLAGRVSMDLLTVDVTHLEDDPEALDILAPAQGVDALADAAGTIGYEILTSLGARYSRSYGGVAA